MANVDSPQEGSAMYDMVRSGMFRLAERTQMPIYSSRYTLTNEALLEVDLLALPHDARAGAEAFAAHHLPQRIYALDPLFTRD